MDEGNKPVNQLVHELQERAKELNCLYKVQELLNNRDHTLEEVCRGIIQAIPPGWQYPDICQARISLDNHVFQTEGYLDTTWKLKAPVVVQDDQVGTITVIYTRERPDEDEGPFLKEERKLINTIAEQLGYYLLNERLREVFDEEGQPPTEDRQAEWWVILNLLRRTDPKLLIRVSRKMVNYLGWNKVPGADTLLEYMNPSYLEGPEFIDINRPAQIESGKDKLEISTEIFQLAEKHLEDQEILDHIHQWIKEDQSIFLVNTLADPGSSFEDIQAAIERYHHLLEQGIELTGPRRKSLRVSLIRRLLSDESGFLAIAKDYLSVDDFHQLVRHTICSSRSHGKVGGKSSGLFLAQQVLKKSPRTTHLQEKLRTPRTWYIASDTIFHFMSTNGLDDIVEQKYKDPDQVRQEYPYVVHVFKNSSFSPRIIKELSHALDDFGDVPLIVRSSSLLEDRMGMAFAGKYKSLFIANQGSKEERLNELMDAISEVYASMFGPDPVEYRLEHGLLDEHEEMGIMIQEVVGTRIGDYYFPAYAGVAFSNNDYPWSSRINREDGLIRIVPGLGTRAVDRLSSDYPILVSPGQPGLRVNLTRDEINRYSPKALDVINLNTRTFESIDMEQLLKDYGRDYPQIGKIVSVMEEDHVTLTRPLRINFENDDLVVTFEGLFSKTPFLKDLKLILDELQRTFHHPVDVEFASDGEHLYLLQCRSQSYQESQKPARIPSDPEPDRVLFSTYRYITNGTVEGITHLVYVNPETYSAVSEYATIREITRAVGRLNKILPRRQFILLGPGRWGSRGDHKLGVKVTWSDISNTAMLIEVARQQGDYLPDPSFGTHFFLDLVEANIRYLALYPDDDGTVFRENILTGTRNQLPELLPEFAHLGDILRVVDLPEVTGGKTLQVLMNAEESAALGLLVGDGRAD